eukprot:2893376-Prymnesium_polylepis.1
MWKTWKRPSGSSSISSATVDRLPLANGASRSEGPHFGTLLATAPDIAPSAKRFESNRHVHTHMRVPDACPVRVPRPVDP